MANSFVFSRQGSIKVNFGIFYQRLDALAQSGINTFQVFGMCSHVVSQEIQEFPQHRIIHGLAGYTRQHHTAVRLDEVANLVAFAQLECMTHRVWNCGLIAVSQCGFEFECVSHGGFSGEILSTYGNANALSCQIITNELSRAFDLSGFVARNLSGCHIARGGRYEADKSASDNYIWELIYESLTHSMPMLKFT